MANVNEFAIRRLLRDWNLLPRFERKVLLVDWRSAFASIKVYLEVLGIGEVATPSNQSTADPTSLIIFVSAEHFQHYINQL